ncbi:helix-turn-helix domain-containing protein [Taklimakanibacter deserti]|uniref:helix-turn-helix domain-containing protein n=1 Tax=Taklimakanibacter deserti TaxID=2267839 RepID=UPI0013C400AE
MTLPPATEEALLAKAVAAIGQPNFYEAVGQWLAQRIKSQQFIVVRYPLQGAPEMIVNSVLPKDVLDLYLGGAYRFDPLMRLWRERQAPCCAIVKELSTDPETVEYYLEAIFRRAIIRDELALLAPAPAPVCVAFCLERRSGEYTKDDLAAAEKLLPVVSELVRQHIEFCILRSGPSAVPSIFGDCRMPLAVIDRTGRTVHANEAWLGQDISRLMPDTFVADILGMSEGQRMLDRDWRLDWHGLADDFPLAPRGSLVMAQKASTAETDEGYAAAFDRFSKRHALTRREIDVARLALLGLSSEQIARRLDLTPGSVRNHRSNVYSKLDVTSEREFFRAFLAEVMTRTSA